MSARHVAVLGAGIMGSSTALFLARRGCAVSLFDAAEQPMAEASRWNEGKIHLGHLYSADPSLRTAQRVLPGGLQFKPLVESLLGVALDGVVTATDDHYLCHLGSVVPPQAMEAYFAAVDELVRAQPDADRYLSDVSGCRTTRLSAHELGQISGSPEISAGFRVPERSVATAWVADRFVDALSQQAHLELFMGHRVTAARPVRAHDVDGAWCIESNGDTHGPFDAVVNALWSGRLAIDLSAGLAPTGAWSHRYRMSLFVRTTEAVELPSAIIATGPFGDVKNYNGRDFYLSWYPCGLMLDSAALAPARPAPLNPLDEARRTDEILDRLETLLPPVRRVRQRSERRTLQGGWVFAAGNGSLSDPQSSLHRRSDFGLTRRGAYVSVDTGKYSTAPWLAQRIANDLLGLGVNPR